MIILLDLDHTLFDTNRARSLVGKEEFSREDMQSLPAETVQSLIYKDVWPFLARVHKAGHITNVLTFGERALQETKFIRSGLRDVIARAWYADGEQKYKVVPRILEALGEGNDFLFFDDRLEELNAMKKYFPAFACVRVRRPGTKYSLEDGDGSFLEITSFDEI